MVGHCSGKLGRSQAFALPLRCIFLPSPFQDVPGETGEATSQWQRLKGMGHAFVDQGLMFRSPLIRAIAVFNYLRGGNFGRSIIKCPCH